VFAEHEQTGTGTSNAKPCRFFVYGNDIDEVLGMFYPGTPASGDPNDMDILTGFIDTWLLDPNDGSYDDTYDDPNDDFIDYFDFANTVADVWTYTPKVPEQHWYYMKDALGSVMGLMGSHSDAESEFYLYDVYGKPNGTSGVGNPYMFTSRRVDVLNGGNLINQHSRRRDLDYYTGRFKTHDPIGSVDGLNLYEYVRSNPTNYVDPLGLISAYYGTNPPNVYISGWRFAKTPTPQQIQDWRSGKIPNPYYRYVRSGGACLAFLDLDGTGNVGIVSTIPGHHPDSLVTYVWNLLNSGIPLPSIANLLLESLSTASKFTTMSEFVENWDATGQFRRQDEYRTYGVSGPCDQAICFKYKYHQTEYWLSAVKYKTLGLDIDSQENVDKKMVNSIFDLIKKLRPKK